MSQISDPPIFSSTRIHTCLYRGFVLVGGGFCPGFFCLEGFVRVVLSVPLLSECIRYNGKLNITFNFRFHMYEFFLKCDVTCSWTPPSVTNCPTFSDPLPHLERDVLYGRPLCLPLLYVCL